MYAIIFAGGSGTRLWPVSRKNSPKQVQPFIDDDSLLQKTYKRVSSFVESKNIFVSTNVNYKNIVIEQLNINPENLILEPEKKDTAAAMGLSAVKLYKKNPEAVMTNVWSDHFIRKTELYGDFVKASGKLVEKYPEKIVLGGINPNYPETGYGYVKMGNFFEKYDNFEVFEVDKFIEKPDLKTAKKYLEKWEYLWNPAMFTFKVKFLLELFKKFEPEMYESLMKIYQALDSTEEASVISQEFEKIKKISIDYAIMEKCKDLLVVPIDIGWADVGNWRTVKDILSKKDSDNVIKGRHLGIDSKNNLIYSFSNKLIATVGINNKIIIETEDSILICDKSRSQDVKKIVDQLEKEDELKGFA